MIRKQKENSLRGIPSTLLFNQSILDVFVLQGILELEDAVRLRSHFKTNREIESFLLKNHLVTKDTINKAYSIILKLPFVELKNIEISEEALKIIPEKIAQKLRIIPFDVDGTLLKIAITEPSDLPLGFASAIKKILKNKRANLELFITGLEDLTESLKQYKNLKGKTLLIKKGSLPVVYLRNRKISRECLNKIPKSFIQKYRLLVFDENIAGHYLIACEKPDSSLTKKILKYIEKENRVQLELFATSGKDIDYVLENYDSDHPFQIEELQPVTAAEEEKPKEKKEFKILTSADVKSAIKQFSSSFKRQETPSLTIDSIFSKKDSGLNPKMEFQINDKTSIINDEEKAGVKGQKEISLIGKIPADYLLKLPKEFIRKYRIVVFGENNEGSLLLATDSPLSENTKKALEFIKNQHKTEIFHTSASDIEYAINIYE